MRTKLTDLVNWPTRMNDQPILACPQEAYLYAQLICNYPKMQNDLTRFMNDTFTNLKFERSRGNPNLKIMMDLAYRARLYRECLGEVLRIEQEMAT